MNCVAASGKSWLGSGSGVGFPIPFPPESDESSFYPLQLPTVIEDDVFIFDYDYCYKPFKNGDRLAKVVVANYLEEWLLNKQLPAAVNLHPEHVSFETRALLDQIVELISDLNIWAPTLQEFADWIKDRNAVEIHVDPGHRIVRVSIGAPVSIVVKVNKKVNDEREITHEYVVGGHSNILDLRCIN